MDAVMTSPAIGRLVDELDTPALLVDLDILDANIGRMASACRSRGVRWRPHVKSVGVPAIAHRMVQAGAIGITCAKLGEAEAMVDAGMDDILIANQIVGVQKVARLVNLAARAAVTVAVDNHAHAAELGAAAVQAGVRLRVVIEVDIGLHRAGVAPGASVVELARSISMEPGLELLGLMGWEGHATRIAGRRAKRLAVAHAIGLLTGSATVCRRAGLPIAVVSCGGTGTYPTAVAQAGVTEVQAGGGVFSDVRYQTLLGVDHPAALTVLTTITSRPSPDRIVCDAGRKTMSGDGGVLPVPIGIGPARSVVLSAEHTTIELRAPSADPGVGSHLGFAVGQADATVHLNNEVFGVRDRRVEVMWPVLARALTR
jgi:D-serine deaminase-like pyridoxal phosphate-dependent protein